MTPKSLREARRRLGYSQADLALGLGLSRASIQRYESGRWPIPKVLAFAMAYLLGTLPKV